MRYLWSAFAALVLVGAAAGGQQLQAAEAANFAYIGTYTHDAPGGDSGKAHSEGIYVAKVDQGTGKLEPVQTVASDNPSFLALSPDQRFLFAINEVDNYEGKNAGSVEAYKIDPGSGKISLINRQALPRADPCPSPGRPERQVPRGRASTWAARLRSSRSAPTAAWARPPTWCSSTAAAPTRSARRRRIRTASCSIRPAATSRPPISASTRSRPCSSRTASSTRSARSPCRRAAGPATSPSARTARCSTSSASSRRPSTALPYDAQSGKLGEPIAAVSTVPADFPAAKSTAEIMVHPSGKFLYGSNRRFSDHPDADAIVVFKLDAKGVPEREQFVTKDIAFPRGFQLDPTGTWLYALNQKGDSIVQLTIDQKTGELTPTGNIAEVPTPVSLVFTTGK